MYWIFAVATLLMIVVLAFTRFPRVERKEDESAGSWQMYRELLHKPIVWFFFLSVFAYVGSEQGTANWISEFLAKYHGYDPHTTGAAAVSWFWGLLTAGCFIGMGLLKIFRIHPQHSVAIGGAANVACQIDGNRKYVAQIVVGVLADQVDAARSACDVGSASVARLECLNQLLLRRASQSITPPNTSIVTPQ